MVHEGCTWFSMTCRQTDHAREILPAPVGVQRASDRCTVRMAWQRISGVRPQHMYPEVQSCHASMHAFQKRKKGSGSPMKGDNIVNGVDPLSSQLPPTICSPWTP